MCPHQPTTVNDHITCETRRRGGPWRRGEGPPFCVPLEPSLCGVWRGLGHSSGATRRRQTRPRGDPLRHNQRSTLPYRARYGNVHGACPCWDNVRGTYRIVKSKQRFLQYDFFMPIYYKSWRIQTTTSNIKNIKERVKTYNVYRKRR